MFQHLKRLFGGTSKASTEGLDELSLWAERRRYTARPVRGDDGGMVVEGRNGADAFRLEWGPSTRSYVEGHELRLRAEIPVVSDLQVLVLNRSLQEAMERAVFEQYVDGVQTRIDNQTPPEMRWLVMFPKLSGSELGPLREGFAAVGSLKPWLQAWLEGPLSSALAALNLPKDQPLVLMLSRKGLQLRTQAAKPDVAQLDNWLKLFDVAMREARRANEQAVAPAPSNGGSAWPSSMGGDSKS
jgi:hypothetical protein